jgi:hypothetical protein
VNGGGWFRTTFRDGTSCGSSADGSRFGSGCWCYTVTLPLTCCTMAGFLPCCQFLAFSSCWDYPAAHCLHCPLLPRTTPFYLPPHLLPHTYHHQLLHTHCPHLPPHHPHTPHLRASSHLCRLYGWFVGLVAVTDAGEGRSRRISALTHSPFSLVVAGCNAGFRRAWSLLFLPILPLPRLMAGKPPKRLAYFCSSGVGILLRTSTFSGILSLLR